MIFIDVINRFIKGRFFDQAAQTAYYLLLSMLPFLLFILSLLSLFPINDEVLLNFLEPFIPIESFKLVENNVYEIVGRSKGNLIVTSLVLAFWISSIAVQSLGRSLDLAYGHVRSSPFWKVIIRDLGITLLFMVVIPLSLFLPFIMRFLRKLVAYSDTIEDLRVWLYIWPNIKWGLGTLFLFAFFLMFYKVVPTGKIKLKEAIPGAAFAALVWQLFSLSFGDYAANVDYTRLYGQLSGIILLVLWFYFTAVIILFAGLLNAEWRKPPN